jgi:hypothetical protein
MAPELADGILSSDLSCNMTREPPSYFNQREQRVAKSCDFCRCVFARYRGVDVLGRLIVFVASHSTENTY